MKVVEFGAIKFVEKLDLQHDYHFQYLD